MILHEQCRQQVNAAANKNDVNAAPNNDDVDAASNSDGMVRHFLADMGPAPLQYRQQTVDSRQQVNGAAHNDDMNAAANNDGTKAAPTND